MTTKVAPVEEYRTHVPPKSVDDAAPPMSKSEGVPPVKRLVSLDAFRGFTMFWIIGGAAVLRALPDLSDDRVSVLLAYEMDHTPWQGLRYYDLIWPCFMLMVGASVAFSYADRSRRQTRTETGQFLV